MPAPPVAWWECYVQVPMPAGDMVSTFLHHLGSTAIVFHEPAVLSPQRDPCVTSMPSDEPQVVLQGAFAADAELSPRLARLQAYLREQAAAFASGPWHLYCRPLHDCAYLTQWRDFFQPINIEHRLWVRPPWDKTPVPDSCVCLTLEPGMAFGTGTHPTTRLALTLLARYVSCTTPGRLLDVGCGSGILSLGALQLGVPNAFGVDIETEAVTVARQNAELNGLQDRAEFRQGSWEKAHGTYAVIAANLYLGPLVNMMHALRQRLQPRGVMILSGLLTFQETALRTALETAHLAVVEQLVEDNWVALAVRHQDALSDPPR
jgi:ribosomal protein L11 methyltransferase